MSSVKMSSAKMDKSEVRPGKNVKSYLKVTVTCPLWVPDCDPAPVLRSNADDALVCGDVCDTELQLVDPSQASNGLGRSLSAINGHKSPGGMSPKSPVEKSQGMRITQLLASSRSVSPVSPRLRGESAIATACAREASASELCGVVGHAAWSSPSNKSAYCKAIVFVDDALLGPLQIERENSPQCAASMRSPSSLMQRRISGQSEHYLQVSTISPKSHDSSPLSPTIPPVWHDEVLRKVGEQSATARQTLVQRYAVKNRYRNRTENADIGTPLPYQVRQNRKTTGLWRSREMSPPSAGQSPQSACVDKKCRSRMTVPVPLPLVSPKPSFMCDTQISDSLSAHALSPLESPDASPSSNPNPRRPNTAEVSTPRSRRTRNVCPRMTAPSVSASHYRPIEVNGDSFVNKDGEQPPCDVADGVAARPATAPVVHARGSRARVKDKERISVPTSVMTGYYVNVANVGRQPETVLESLLQVTGTKAARTSPRRDHGLD